MPELTKILTLKNEVEANLIVEILKEKNIPHILRNFYDSALDGIYQMQLGWGIIESYEEYREEITRIYDEIVKEKNKHHEEEINTEDNKDNFDNIGKSELSKILRILLILFLTVLIVIIVIVTIQKMKNKNHKLSYYYQENVKEFYYNKDYKVTKVTDIEYNKFEKYLYKRTI